MEVDRRQQSQYERLRSWYLASLRRRAINEPAGVALTPAALISADRDMVELLIAGRERQSTGDKSLQLRFVVYGWLSGIVAIWLFFSCTTGSGITAITQLFRLTIGLLVLRGPGDPLKPEPAEPWCNTLVTLFFFGWPLWWFLIQPLITIQLKRRSKSH